MLPRENTEIRMDPHKPRNYLYIETEYSKRVFTKKLGHTEKGI